MRISQKIAMSCAVFALSIAFASGHAFAQAGGPFAGPGSLNFNGMSKPSQLNDSTLGGAQTNVAPILTPTPGGIFNFAPQGITPAKKRR